MGGINELEGEALAEAVALAQEWERYSGDSSQWVIERPGVRMWQGSVEGYRPDRDISQAWELVETMRNDGYRLDPLRHDRLGFSLAYIVRFIHEDGDGLPWEAGFIGRGYTAPVAICRAFLKAKATE